jgi:hypothetical protein
MEVALQSNTSDSLMWNDEEIFIVVKTYPLQSKSHVETVCTAGITKDNRWIRLYPVRFRYLPFDKRFTKYQWISAEVQKLKTDSRPETYRLKEESIRLGNVIKPFPDNWSRRREIVLPLLNESVEELQFLQRETGQSLGIIKVEELCDFRVTPGQSAPLAVQQSLFEDVHDLDPIPLHFRYRFRCAGEGCKGLHDMSIIDWEIGELYRRAREKCATEREICDYLAGRFVDMMFSPKRETYFFLGTHRWHPASFMICGVFYFEKEP